MIASGTRLGPYEIVAPLGAGGMGEVYRARDTRLDRSVAVKVLPAEFARDAQLRQRFEREARSISQLSHPNICTLYDVGRDGDRDYLVMELLEGDSLADRLARGALPLADVLRYGVQIAEALARAHRQGIVHRDLKPGNVMITRSGAKLLDFGLSKTAAAAIFAADAPTQQQHKPLTAEGTIVGTFQYMAPEQLEGVEADARTDIFALGCVLYEMLTGQRAFQGATRTSLIAAIVSAEPKSPAHIQPLTPPALEHVIRKCLEKDPDDRWQSAHDVATELQWVSESGLQAGVATPGTRRRRTRERLLWATALLVAAAGAAVAGHRLLPRSVQPPPVVRAEIELEPPLFPGTPERAFDISPDGRWLVYIGTSDGVDHMYLRRLDGLTSTQLPGTRGARSPFFSPDSRQIAFRAAARWKVISVTGGQVQTLVDCMECWTPSWADDGSILFASSERGIERVTIGGGREVLVPAMKGKEYGNPSLLPGGNAVLLAIDSQVRGERTEIAAYDLKAKRFQTLTTGVAPRYVPPGYLVYLNTNALTAAPFNPETLKLDDSRATGAEAVARHPVTGDSLYSVSAAGIVAYISGTTGLTNARLVWVDRQGRVEPLPVPPRPYANPSLSADGTRVVFAIRDELTDVWSLDLRRSVMSRLTFVPTENEMPLWLPGRNDVVYSASRSGEPRIHLSRAADGSGQERRLFSSRHHQHLTSVSPDGTTLLATEFHPERGADVLMTSLDGKNARPLFATPFDELNARFSPDGRWIAYTSTESGRHEVYVIGRDGNGKWQISTEGGYNPVWSRDGRELFYLAGRRMFVVDVSTADAFTPSVPRPLFEGDFELTPRGDTNYDVAADGQRFLMVQSDTSSGNRGLTLVANWLSEVERDLQRTSD